MKKGKESGGWWTGKKGGIEAVASAVSSLVGVGIGEEVDEEGKVRKAKEVNGARWWQLRQGHGGRCAQDAGGEM